MNLNLLCHGEGYSPSQIMSFSKYGGGSVIYNDLKSVWALHSSGEMQKFQTFSGTLQMEDLGEEDDFLVWK